MQFTAFSHKFNNSEAGIVLKSKINEHPFDQFLFGNEIPNREDSYAIVI